MLKSNQIFIHIPKTGGTTLNFLFFGKDVPINPNYNYRHIVYETKMSNSADIFNPLKNDKYLDHQIFMMLRHPIDRVISEYYFLRERAEFFSLIKPVPKNFKDYVNSRQTFNYNISFLLGKRIYSEDLVDRSDYEMLLNAIEKLDIKIGIFERFSDSLNFFSNELGIKTPKRVESKRVTIKRPRVEDIGKELQEKILKNNSLDLELYNYAKNKFDKRSFSKNTQIEFVGDKYDYALTYTNRFSLFEISMKDKTFIRNNQAYFKELSNYIHQANISKAVDFVDTYIMTTLNTLKSQIPKVDFSTIEESIINVDPLKKLDILSHFIENKKQLKAKKIFFDKNLVILLNSTPSFKDKLFKFFKK